jgi:DinB superfamily
MTQEQGTVDLGNLLLRRLHKGYGELLSELRSAGEGGGADLVDETGWSLRDHVAHLSAWEAVELARAEGRPGLREHLGLAWEAAWGRRLGGSLGEALEAFGGVHRRLIEVLTDLPDAVLRRPWHSAYPDTLAANIARNTYRHYAEHLTVVRQATRQASAAP